MKYRRKWKTEQGPVFSSHVDDLGVKTLRHDISLPEMKMKNVWKRDGLKIWEKSLDVYSCDYIIIIISINKQFFYRIPALQCVRN